MLAAQGAFAPRAHEQLALLLVLADDPDPAIAATAAATIDALAAWTPWSRFMGAARMCRSRCAIFRGAAASSQDRRGCRTTTSRCSRRRPARWRKREQAEADPRVLSSLPIIDRMKLAMRGTREQRSQLIRDSNKLVAVAVLSSPKLNESEVEEFRADGQPDRRRAAHHRHQPRLGEELQRRCGADRRTRRRRRRSR